MFKDNGGAHITPQPAGAAPGDLELKSVGTAKLVVTFHRNAYGVHATGLPAKAA